MSKNLIFGVGAVIGIILLALAAMAANTAIQWAQIDRDGAAVGWGIVTFFLTLAGIGAIAGSANHAFRVIDRPAAHH